MYKEVIQAIINKYIALMGISVVTKYSEKAGVHIDEGGTVLNFDGDGRETTKKLINKFTTLSGSVAITFAKDAIRPFLAKNPELESLIV